MTPATTFETVLQAQAKFRQELGLFKVKAILNKNYQPNGTKSYVYLLIRFSFRTTKPGPYYQHAQLGIIIKKTADGKHKPVPVEDQQNDSMYLCEVSIGTPAQKLMLDFDTGSSDLWVRSTEEARLLHKGDKNAFDADKSSTFEKDPSKKWKIEYGDGSEASGIVGYDTVTIGGLAIKKQAIELARHVSRQFAQGTADGLLGLAFHQINTITTKGSPDPQPTPVDNMITQEDIPKDAELFTSAFYSTRDEKAESFYTFGWIDEDLIKASGEKIAWADIDNSEGFWKVKSEYATINGEKVSVSGNTAIVDTGTTLALMQDDVVDALYKAIDGAKYSEEYQGYIVPNSATADKLPEFKVCIGEKEFLIQKEDLLFAPADSDYWYGGVQSRGSMPFDILGDTFLKSIYAIWDQGNKRFGAVPKIEKKQNTSAPSGSETGEDATAKDVLSAASEEAKEVSDKVKDIGAKGQEAAVKEATEVSDKAKQLAVESEEAAGKKATEVSEQAKDTCAKGQEATVKEATEVSNKVKEIAVESEEAVGKKATEVSEQAKELGAKCQEAVGKKATEVSEQAKELGAKCQEAAVKEATEVSDKVKEIAVESEEAAEDKAKSLKNLHVCMTEHDQPEK